MSSRVRPHERAADEGSSTTTNLVGLISDTHGLVRAEVHRALAGVEVILHAGDVGGDDVLTELALIAPVHAVAGNTDPPGEPDLPLAREYRVDRVIIHVSHGHELGSPTPAGLVARYPDADVIVYGHTHQASVARIGTQLVINPGAAGPARFKLKPSVALLRVTGRDCDVELVPLG